MKKKYYTKTIALLTILFICCFFSSAQTKIDIPKNDSLFIDLNGYKQGNIFWEYSTSKTGTWNSIAKDVETLRYKLTFPCYVRSRVIEEGCDPVISDTIQVNVIENKPINAGQGYTEKSPFVMGSGINMKEKGILSDWTDQNSKAVWFLYQTAGSYNVQFFTKSTLKKDFSFEMKTSQAYISTGTYNPESFAFTCSTRGGNLNDTIKAFTITIPKTGYYRYELNTKSNLSGLTINQLWFNAIREPGNTTTPDVHATDYLSSPSVHLSFSSTANTTKSYDWLYEEILVPEGYDPIYTYWMSIGFFCGYMGIQTNSDAERRVLFSVWDSADRDKYPDAPKELLAELVDKASYVQANSFGNEGTGGQSYVGKGDPNTWKTGTPIKFLMNARRDGSIVFDGKTINHTLISAWYDAGDGWRYIATWRAKRPAGQKDMFDGFYSFLENFGFKNGQIARKGYYYNAFGRELGNNKWVNFNKVSFTNTDGAQGQRIDFEQGVDDRETSKFYMLSGGYGGTKKSTNTLPLLDAENIPNVKNLDLNSFSQRVDAAIEREAFLKNIQYKSKTNWQVVNFSSQELSGEGTNGHAAQIIDGNENTYWHSKWQGGRAEYPHWLIVDMVNEQNIKGFKFVHNGRQDRKMKDIKIEVSNSPTGGWTEVWSGVAPYTPDLLELDNEVSGYRYFRLTITSGTATDGPFVNLFELYVF